MPLVGAVSALAVLFSSCTGRHGSGHGEPALLGVDSAVDSGETADGGADTAFEPCDGTDNDGDGAVDEGSPDTDHDGSADCVDSDCLVAGSSAAAVGTDNLCSPSVLAPWAAEIKWQFVAATSDPDANQSFTTPIVAQLDADGAADIVLAPWGFHNSVTLIAIRGDGKGELWEVAGDGDAIAVVVADVDGSGSPEVIAETTDGGGRFFLRAYDGATGVGRWQSEFTDWGDDLSDSVGTLSLADTTGDGLPEVITGAGIFGGIDGEPIVQFPMDTDLFGPWGSPYILRGVTNGDIDGDGVAEIVVGGTVYAADGTIRWRVPPYSAQYAAIVQADSDPSGEVAMVGAGLDIYDTDGSLLASSAESFTVPNPPCVADLDGDGASEIVFADDALLYAYHMDASLLWVVSGGDHGGISGCAAWDVDGDGAAEVLYGGQSDFVILDGRTGSIRYDEQTRYSITYGDAPVVADIDGDGSAEILYVNCHEPHADYPPMLTVLGHTGGTGWPSGDGLWPSPDYAIDNIGEAGQVPPPTDWWNTRGMYRAKPAGSLPNGANLRAAITDVCVASCDAANGLANVEVQLSNVGPNDAPGDTSVTLYRDDGVVLATLTVADPVPSGTAGDGFTFTIDANAVGTHGLRVVVDDDGSGVGAVGECDETDNAGVWETPLCP